MEPAVKQQSLLSPSDYLELERKAPAKHEYAGGKIIAMAGASLNHNKILTKLIRHIDSFLEEKSCDIYPSDLRIWVEKEDSYFYPDATIICGDPEFFDNKKDTVKNPSVIFEILSPSTEDFDLGKKFFSYYNQIKSLQQYITIDSSACQVRSGIRQQDNSWNFVEIMELEDKLHIIPIGFELLLKDIYKGIVIGNR